jgi:hypothetical protein
MSCTVLIALEPAVERFLLFWIPGIGDFGAALNITPFIIETIVGVAICQVALRPNRARTSHGVRVFCGNPPVARSRRRIDILPIVRTMDCNNRV